MRLHIEPIDAWVIVNEWGERYVEDIFDDEDDARREMEAYLESEDYEESVRNERW